MTGVKISELPAAGTLTGSEPFPLVQNGATVRTPISDLVAMANGNFVLAESYGTDRNEITFNLAAADALARGLNVLVGPGTWTSTDGGTFTNPGVEVVGAGPNLTRFVKVGLNSCFQTLGTTPTTGTTNTLASNAAIGDKSITLAAGKGANFTVGQKCILLSNDLLLAAGVGKCAEFVTVQSIAGDVVGLWGPLKFAYTTANTAELVAVTLVSGVGYRNLTIQMDDTATVDDSSTFQAMFATDLRWCRRPVIENVTVTNIVHAGMFFTGCSGAKITNCRISDGGSTTSGTSSPTPSDGTPGFGYGVREDALNEELAVSGLTAERLRHGYTCTAGYSSVWGYGAQYGTTISNSVHIDAKDAGWDTHMEAFALKFIGCGTVGGRTSGFQIRSRGALLDGCYALRTFGPGLWLRGGASGASDIYGDECLITGFYAAETNFGVDPITSLDWRENGAIIDDGIDNKITGALAIRCGGPMLTIGRNGVANRGTYSALTARDPCQLAATNKYAIHILGTQSPANLEISDVTVHSTDAKVVHVVYRGTTFPNLKLKGISGYGHTGALVNSITSSAGLVIMPGCDGPQYLSRFGARQYDDFTGNTISNFWKTSLVGTDPQCIIATIVTTNPYGGRVRMTAGDDAGATMALNGVSLLSALNWRAEAGNLTAEFKLTLGSVAAECIYAGFTDDVTTLEMPFTLAAGNVLTSNASNGCGFLYDTDADTDQWWLVGVANNVDSTKQVTGIVPVSSTFQRLRVDVGSTGIATFFINGVLIGTAMTGATTASTPLTPIVAIFSRTTAVKTVDIDHIYVEQDGIV